MHTNSVRLYVSVIVLKQSILCLLQLQRLRGQFICYIIQPKPINIHLAHATESMFTRYRFSFPIPCCISRLFHYWLLYEVFMCVRVYSCAIMR